MSTPPSDIRLVVDPPADNAALNALMVASHDEHEAEDFAPVLSRSLVYVLAYEGDALVGFVYVATDGRDHAFLLDPTVPRSHRRRGIGSLRVQAATREARARGAKWLHVDYEPHLESFYAGAGFRPTQAGLIRLDA